MRPTPALCGCVCIVLAAVHKTHACECAARQASTLTALRCGAVHVGRRGCHGRPCFRVRSVSGIDTDVVVMLATGQWEARETMELLKKLPVDLMCEIYGAALD